MNNLLQVICSLLDLLADCSQFLRRRALPTLPPFVLIDFCMRVDSALASLLSFLKRGFVETFTGLVSPGKCREKREETKTVTKTQL